MALPPLWRSFLAPVALRLRARNLTGSAVECPVGMQGIRCALLGGSRRLPTHASLLVLLDHLQGHAILLLKVREQLLLLIFFARIRRVSELGVVVGGIFVEAALLDVYVWPLT